MNLNEFFKNARVKGKAKAISAPAPVEVEGEEKVSPEEENFFKATLGLRFLCGVCHRRHKTSKVGEIKVLDKCIKILARAVSGGAFIPDDKRPTHFQMTHCGYYSERDEFPGNALFETLQPKGKKTFEALVKRLNQLYSRTIREDIRIGEILGAPNSRAFLREQRDRFHKDAIKQLKVEVGPEHRELEAHLKRFQNWRKIKPEKLKIKDIEYSDEEKWLKRSDTAAIDRVYINGEMYDDDLIAEFPTDHLNAETLCWRSHEKNFKAYRVLLDVHDLDGWPAIVWAYRFKKGVKADTAKVAFDVRIFSKWNGENYLTTETNVERALYRGEDLLKLEPFKEGRR